MNLIRSTVLCTGLRKPPVFFITVHPLGPMQPLARLSVHLDNGINFALLDPHESRIITHHALFEFPPHSPIRGLRLDGMYIHG